MSEVQFKGFSGVRLNAVQHGEEDAPPVLLLHGLGQTRAHWADAAAALELAGRSVINLDMRGHGTSEWPGEGQYDFDAFVDDLRAVLAQLPARPAIVAASLGGWAATVALGEDGAHLASALILVDAPPQPDANATRALGEELHRRTEAGGAPSWDSQFLAGIDINSVSARLNAAIDKLAVPVLFVRSADSVLANHESVEACVSRIPNAELVEVEGADHLMEGEQSEIFNGLLLDFLERRAPLAPPEYREGSDARTFRDALGCFATGVTIVTATSSDGSPVGLTANSFTSVSLDPPLLLVCIGNTAGSAQILAKADRFAVNVLQIGQQPTSNRFAGKSEDRFANTPWTQGEFGTPVLTGSLGSFECERHAIHEGGDHFILVGRVLKAMFEPRRDPLLYFRGKYRRLHFA